MIIKRVKKTSLNKYIVQKGRGTLTKIISETVVNSVPILSQNVHNCFFLNSSQQLKTIFKTNSLIQCDGKVRIYDRHAERR